MIRVLDKTVADKIAAGEVIDRPVSIVKELVENSLDADATSITVEIRKGGKEYLRITDDGCGIPAEETGLAFERHATSKIRTESDLDAIRSLGFRGEALASVCAVARVDMITKPAEAHVGTHVVAEGSEILQQAPTGCPDGTTITVKDLFYNVPARKKFLGSDGAEGRRIIDLMSRIALAYPDVRFRLINGGREVFATTGRGSILDNICRIYGRDLGRDLVSVDASADGMLLRGFVTSPGTSSSSRNRQFFCVNGRVVSSHTIERGLEKAYRERLFPGRFPIAFLFLQIPPDQLDVNVHPTKKEIRFDADAAVEDFITESVAGSLQAKEAIPAAKAGHSLNQEEPEPEAAEQAASEQVDIKNLLQSLRQEASMVREETILEPGTGSDTGLNPEKGSGPETGSAAAAPETAESSRPAEPEKQPLQIDALEVIGSVLNTYILATDGQSLCVIDQHAAHERVFYEKLLKQYHSEEKLQQEMLLPLQISVSAAVASAEEAWIGHLRKMGYDIEAFGNRTYIVRAMPAFADAAEAEGFLRQMLLELENKPDPHSFAGLDRLIMRSCKSAIKGGDVLHPEEIRALLTQLARCERPWSCPHGRPTIVRMTKYDLEKMFKR